MDLKEILAKLDTVNAASATVLQASLHLTELATAIQNEIVGLSGAFRAAQAQQTTSARPPVSLSTGPIPGAPTEARPTHTPTPAGSLEQRTRDALQAPAPTVAAPAGPTEDQVAKNEAIRLEMLGHFLGSGSVFTRYLSPDVISSGKGFIKPSEEVKLYMEDVFTVSPTTLEQWPTGFYRNKQTMDLQFFVNTARFLVVLSGLPDNAMMPLIASRERGSSHALQFNTIDKYNLLSMKYVYTDLMAELHKYVN